jgi:hypothetical protein
MSFRSVPDGNISAGLPGPRDPPSTNEGGTEDGTEPRFAAFPRVNDSSFHAAALNGENSRGAYGIRTRATGERRGQAGPETAVQTMSWRGESRGYWVRAATR